MRTHHLSAALMAVLLAACTSGPVSPSHGGTGGVKVLLTDSPFPFDQMSRADLYIVRVTAGTDSGSTGSACSGAIPLAEPRQRFNLLDLQRGTTADLGQGSLPDGDYTAVCITINTDSSSLTLKTGQVLDHASDPGVNWSATGERIIKADIFRPIAVVDTTGTFVIHFDVGRSFIPAADVEPVGPEGWFYYVPAIDVVDPSTVGSVTGTVMSGDSLPLAGASIRAMVGDPAMDPGTWYAAATGTSDGTG